MLSRVLNTCQKLNADLLEIALPPEDGGGETNERVFPMSLVRDTRGYIERIALQINGCYDSGWYDACAVMMRRLLETLIIEVFEACGIASKIKSPSGDFYYLGDLITSTLSESSWNLSRNTKTSLPKLKDVGDKSAHSRRFNAHRRDIEGLVSPLRDSVQELVYLARLK